MEPQEDARAYEQDNLYRIMEASQLKKTSKSAALMAGEAREREYSGGGRASVESATTHRMTAKNTSKDEVPTMFSEEAMRRQPFLYREDLAALERTKAANVRTAEGRGATVSVARMAGGGAPPAPAPAPAPVRRVARQEDTRSPEQRRRDDEEVDRSLRDALGRYQSKLGRR
jgi:hypothetical protein